jgi:hypothetical protein
MIVRAQPLGLDEASSISWARLCWCFTRNSTCTLGTRTGESSLVAAGFLLTTSFGVPLGPTTSNGKRMKLISC